MYRKSIERLLLFLVLAMPLAAHALSSDRTKPVNLTADKAKLNNATGVSVYTGNVVLTQGTLKITGDKLTVYTNKNHQLEKAVVVGNLATYQQLPDGQKQYVHATAPRMEYYANGPERIRLLDGATLTQGKNRFTGKEVDYNVEKDLVNATSGNGGGKRIKITIYPNKKNTGNESKRADQ